MEEMKSEKQDLEAMIPVVVLPDEYRGKILFVLIIRGHFRNTRAEMIGIGLRDVRAGGRRFAMLGAYGSDTDMGASHESGRVTWTMLHRS
jgi:hypothetical protein